MNRPIALAPALVSVVAASLALAGCRSSEPRQAIADPVATYRQAIGSMIAADGPTALAQLRALPAQGLTDQQRVVVGCILSRFGVLASDQPTSNFSAPPEASIAVLAACRRYWSAMLVRPTDKEPAELALRQALEIQTGVKSPELAVQTEAARALLERQGLHALGGVTAPLHELMVWRKQTSRTEIVSLPEESIDVSVTLLDNFISLGWLAYATCDRHHTGGWATPEGVWVVAPSWDLTSEDYRISLLAHEAQHLADFRRYPRLGSADLEYRAKLVELILADATQRTLLENFAAQARPERASPHAFASHCVLTGLRKRLATSDLMAAQRDRLREAARTLLRQHTESLAAIGNVTVQTALP